MIPFEFAYILALGGVLQSILLILLQAIYNRRSSLGVQLSALRDEMVKREDALRLWVKDSIAQMEADSMTRDSALHAKMADLHEDPVFISRLSEAVAIAVVQLLIQHKAVRREATLLEPLNLPKEG